MTGGVRLVSPESPGDWGAARVLIEAYAASLELDLSFQDFAHELEHLAIEYAPPGGAFLLAEADGARIGCVGLRRFSGSEGEVKRLYVAPAARGLGAGRLLAEAIVAEGWRLGYERLLLDTLPAMQAARGLYASLGFRPMEPYRYNPVAGTTFMELDLRGPTRPGPRSPCG